jgi:hypothetical protein
MSRCIYSGLNRIVIPTGAKRSGGTCCLFPGSHADSFPPLTTVPAGAESPPLSEPLRHDCLLGSKALLGVTAGGARAVHTHGGFEGSPGTVTVAAIGENLAVVVEGGGG